jgi:gliding motility-associated-like protein
VLSWTQISFVENKGQWPNKVLAASDLPTGKLWIENHGLTYQLLDPSFIQALHPGSTNIVDSIRGHNYHVRWVNSNSATFSGESPQSHYLNYYIGEESSWASGVRVYSSSLLPNIYDKIDARIHAPSGGLKYDFIVHPGASPNDIRLAYEHTNGYSLIDGELHIETSVGKVVEARPFAYQVKSGKVITVSCTYELIEGIVRFSLGEYDHSVDLIIDPEIAFSTFVGSTASNFGFTACNDLSENLISGAAVFNPGYPTTTGAFNESFNGATTNYMDIGVSKFSSNGTQLLYSTYFGGSRQETPHSLIVDSEDNILLMGVTGSPDLAVTSSVYQPLFVGGPQFSMVGFFTSSHLLGCDIFVSKFSNSGSLLASTFVGGPGNDGLNNSDQLYYNYGDAFRGEINIDDQNNIYVASCTRGDFPMLGTGAQTSYGGGFSDGLLFKMSSDLSTLLLATYLGGVDNDACYAIEFDNQNNLIVAGGTKSLNFPHVFGGADISFDDETDGFILRINPTDFSVINGTYVGTPEYDQVYFLQTDMQGNIYALGQTEGDMPISPGLYGQPNSGQFIRKFNQTLTIALWTTTIGTGSGEIDISLTAFLVSDCDQIFFSGWGGETNSTTCGSFYDCYAQFSTTVGLPISPDAFQPNTDGSDFYLCVLEPNATGLIYASYLGGGESAEHVDGGTSRFAKNGTVYQAVCAGCQGNSDFPSSPGAWSPTNPSQGCNLAVFRFNLGQIEATVEIDGPNEICVGTPANFLNLSQGGDSFEWILGDGFTSTESDVSHIYATPGVYEVQLIVDTELECLIGDTTSVTITILPGPTPTIEPVPPVCPETTVSLVGSGSSLAYWVDNPLLSDETILTPTAVVSVPTTFYLVDENECGIDTISVLVDVFEINTSVSDNQSICIGSTVELEATGGAAYVWTPDLYLNTNTSGLVTSTPTETITYNVEITTADNCVTSEDVTVNVDAQGIGGLVYDTITICFGNNVTLQAQSANSYLWSPSNSLSSAVISNPVATPTSTTTYSVLLTNACAQGTDEVTVEVIPPAGTAEGGGVICDGGSVSAYGFGGVEYRWEPQSMAFPFDNDTTILSPTETTTFTLYVIDENGCGSTATVDVFILDSPQPFAGPDMSFEYPDRVQLIGSAFTNTYQWYPATGLSCTNCLFPFAQPLEPTYYVLEVISDEGCIGRDSVLVTPYFPIWVPNTVTADNDGINDVFRAVGQDIKGFHLMIFNRWGDLIFESRDIDEPWVPGLNGYYVQDGTYQWIIEYDSIDRRKRLVGHVNVLR